MADEGVPFGRRLSTLAGERGDATAVVFARDDGEEELLSWRSLERQANQVARLLAGRGVEAGDVVVVGLVNSPSHLAATFGAWKLGASVLPLRPGLPAWERDRLLGIAGARLVIGDWDDPAPGTITTAMLATAESLDPAPPVQDRVPPYIRLLATSGSTGTPKIIVGPSPGLYVAGGDAPTGLGSDARTVLLCASPLYHTNGFQYCYPPLLEGGTVVLMEHFDAARAVSLIETHRVTMTVLVPTMLQRIARLDGVQQRDFSSLQRVFYGGASLPEWVARIWLRLIPPERFTIIYGGSERVGATVCTGEEWLERPGTVGAPLDCDIAILDAGQQPLAPGEIGEIWMRLHSDNPPFEYIGTPTPEPILDGYRTFGDMGWVDGDGYLYIADRRHDMIVTGGVNVFPAEVEAALSEHPQIADAVVIGLPDPEWGHRVHALVQPADPGCVLPDDELRTFCKARLSGPKVPKSFEMVGLLPRTGAGKINRSRLIEERTGV